MEKIGAPFGQLEWSALSLIEDPDFVFRAHIDFINAGADVIVAGTATFEGGQEHYAKNISKLRGK